MGNITPQTYSSTQSAAFILLLAEGAGSCIVVFDHGLLEEQTLLDVFVRKPVLGQVLPRFLCVRDALAGVHLQKALERQMLVGIQVYKAVHILQALLVKLHAMS